MNKKNVQTIFFDLDGTLFDTAPDLSHALNETLRQFNRPPVSLKKLRHHIYGGSRTIILCGFEMDDDHPLYPTIRALFLENYSEHLAVDTCYFPGMDTVLDLLDQQNIPWGIITNKPGFLTEPLLAHFGLDKRSQCIISGDSLAKRKPSPDPLYHACHLTQSNPKQSVYIGDTETDIQAAKAAGMMSIAASYGYHQKETHPHQWMADCVIESPQELLAWLKK